MYKITALVIRPYRINRFWNNFPFAWVSIEDFAIGAKSAVCKVRLGRCCLCRQTCELGQKSVWEVSLFLSAVFLKPFFVFFDEN